MTGNRRTFFASLAALVAAPAVRVKPVFSFRRQNDELAASIREMQLALDRAEHLMAASRRLVGSDDLAAYVNQLTAEHHATLNAKTSK